MVGRRSLFFLGQGLFSGSRTLGVFRDATCFLVISSGHLFVQVRRPLVVAKRMKKWRFLQTQSFPRHPKSSSHTWWRSVIFLDPNLRDWMSKGCSTWIHHPSRCLFLDQAEMSSNQKKWGNMFPFSDDHTQMLHAWHISYLPTFGLNVWYIVGKCSVHGASGIVHFGILVNLLS